MNVRKPVDYATMFAELDTLIATELPQMELYCEIGRVVSGRPEKCAAVAAAEYLCNAYPDASGFSPRNLRRMREFYRMYENTPEVMAAAMSIGWTQNVVILEAEMTLQERLWYIRAVRQFAWSKLVLLRKIEEHAHESIVLDNEGKTCYSQDMGSDENGSKEASGALLQGLRDAEIQRELQRKRPRGSYMQSLLPALAGTAGGADDAPASGKSAVSPSERERDDMAGEPHTRQASRGTGACLHGLFRKIPSPGAKSEEAGIVHNKAGAVYRRRGLRSLWRSCVYKRKLHCQPEAALNHPHTAGQYKRNGRSSAKGDGKAAQVGCTHAGDLLLGAGFLQPCRC